ncbi:type II toxin-antitoxin system HicB family antitoxin [Candidatus Peregrinibacteria bacterium]|jgi:predicted RNase H-like HicB family nuclease|nr:type II toxin-antitoxin system HicB family antitoxin [Candidatus Peregrinibacteria bacterium]
MVQYAFIFKDGKYYVAKHPCGVASQGATVEESLSNLKEALELYYEDSPNQIQKYQESFISSFEIEDHKIKHAAISV